MQGLTEDGRRIVESVANRHGFSNDAASQLLMALAAGGGWQAQFSHPELGGMGQWSSGGMIMIGDMFNNGLKYRVDALCNDLASVLRDSAPLAPFAPISTQSQNQSNGQNNGQNNGQYQSNGQSNGQYQSNGQNQNYGQSQSQSNGAGMNGGMNGSGSSASLFVPGSAGNRWPAELGNPSSAGSQNDLHYAVFPQARRLAISRGGQVSVYDTGNHVIGGFSQQQGNDQSLTFTSQFGRVRLFDLPMITNPVTPDAGNGSSNASGNASSNGGGNGAADQGSANFAPPPAPFNPAPIAQPVPISVSAPAPAPSPPEASAFVPPSPSAPVSQPLSSGQSDDEIFSRIERLADLRQKDIITAQEFEAKKAELLARL